MTAADPRWRELAKNITADQRLYEKLAADYWDSFDIAKAVRFRGMAEGYKEALGLVMAAAQQPGPFVPARDNHGDRAWISDGRTTLAFAHVDLTEQGYRELYVLAETDGAQ